MSARTLVADGAQPRHQMAHGALVQVAVGVLQHADGRFLMTSRPAGKAYAGYWEFPGGKLEAGETVAQALVRELREELGLVVDPADVRAWRALKVDYPHALVQLHFCKLMRWSGALQMREHQQCAWTDLPVTLDPVLPGALPVLDWLAEERRGAAPR